MPKQEGRQRTPSAVHVDLRPEPLDAPDPPEGLLDITVSRWDVYFASDLARAISDVDFPVIGRLFCYYDEWERISRDLRARDSLIDIGSAGQERLHPLARRLTDLEAVISRLEGELGVTPMARARLGITIGAAALTWEQVNRMARGGEPDADTDAATRQVEQVINLS